MRRGSRAPRPCGHALIEPLETRRFFALVRPDHVVVVIEQDRASDAIGNINWPYLNSLAASGLVYSNSHGVTHPSEPNTLALFSGSTQGITDNGRNYSFGGPNLAKSLFDAGLSFSWYSEDLPADGSQVAQAGNAQYPDLYTRNLNGAAQFTNLGTLPSGAARPNAAVNKTFDAFRAIAARDFNDLPTISYIVPNNLNNAHGSNEAYPWAGSPDEENNDVLRRSADAWLHDNLDDYLQWAKTHNSLLIVTQDEERWTGGSSQTVTTLVHGDPRLFAAGTNPASVNHYNLVRTLEDMYGLPRLNATAAAAPLATDSIGRLAPSASTPVPTLVNTATRVISSANPSTAGQAVTFTAKVTPASGTTVPTGTVTFFDGAAVLGTAAVNASGIATFTTSGLSAATHTITASYGGNAIFKSSASAPLSQVVNAAPVPVVAPVNVALVAQPTSSTTYGQLVTFTATVTPVSLSSATLSGTMTFRDGATVLGSATLDSGGVASFPINALAVGGHSITAAYGGDTAFAAATSATLVRQVNAPTVAPGNDSFAARWTLSGGGSITAHGTNILATRQGAEPRHAGYRNGKSVWWRWTAPAAGPVTIDTFGSTFNTTLGVYTGSSLASLSTTAFNDNAGGAGSSSASASRVTFTAVAGRVYQIAVDGANQASGAITLHLTQTASLSSLAAPAQAQAAPPARIRTALFSSAVIRKLTAELEDVLS